MKRILSLVLACLLLVSTLSVTVSCSEAKKSEAKTEEKTAAKTTAPASSAASTAAATAPASTAAATQAKPTQPKPTEPKPTVPPSSSGSSSVQKPSAYTKGSFDGSAYTNQWADLKVTLPEGYTNGTEAQYDSLDKAMSDPGFVFVAPDSMSSLVLMFEKLPVDNFSEEQFLNNVLQVLENNQTVDYEISHEFTRVSIGGKLFSMGEAVATNLGILFKQQYLIRIFDGYAIAFVLTDVNANVLSILTANASALSASSSTVPPSSSGSSSVQKPSAYTKGSFDGSVYTNEWADLKVTLPEGYTNSSEERYASFENATTDCGFCFEGDGGASVISFVLEKLPTALTAEEYLDLVMSRMEDSYPSDYTVKLPDRYTTCTVGGAQYKVAKVEVSVGGVTIEQDMLVRAQGDYVLAFAVVDGFHKGVLNTLIANASRM